MQKNNAQEQIIAKLKESESILIAVNDNPTVDELASALALTLAINKSGKHATAVASGEMPDALTFLRPEKTFENSVDSLRDFIIALNKEKADHLRYKLVGDHVKIFITPYRAVISEKDLEFEQGDFNVDFVLAVGVRDKEHLDGALAAHGKIFHDATVGILTIGEDHSDLNGINWHNENASSLSELTIKIIESLDKKSLSQPVATALLTGIVSQTDRFSNAKATAEVMSLSAKLISAGADQQLVVSKIREAEEKAGEFAVQKNSKMEEALEEISNKKPEAETVSKTKQKRDGAFVISHEAKEEPKIEAEEVSKIEEAPVEEISAEDELSNSLEELQNQAPAAPNAFAELDEVQNNEIIEEVPAPVEAQTFEPAPQVEVAAAENFEAPVEQAQPQVAAEDSSNNNLVQAPIENYAPEIPAPSSPFENQNAFISEAPVEAQTFEPAPQVEVAAAENFEAPVEQAQPQVAPEPVFENANVQENYPTEVAPEPAQPIFGAVNYEPKAPADEYYHPEENAQLVNSLSSAQVQQDPLQRDPSEAATSNPEDNSYVLSHNSVASLGEQSNPDNMNFIPETNAYAQAQTIQPLSNFGDQNQNQNQIPAPEPFSGIPLPPPIPDFNSMNGLPELPPIPNFENFAPAPTQPTDQAYGAQNSGNTVMTDQIYPQDPSQFRIPGM